ncbi:hypothetical protein [Streptomyces sp. NPDC093018]|uniref:hypothetical protein n=1 Tax=Streptomyces sp. NPDC093018 TaxID=3155067 RepID=UPI0034231510
MARGSADYLLFIDADDEMRIRPKFRMPELTLDAYNIALHDGPVVHWRMTLVATRLPWRYEGVLHEHITCDAPHSAGALEGAHILTVGDGARLRDAEEPEKALAAYDKRAEMAGWAEETY